MLHDKSPKTKSFEQNLSKETFSETEIKLAPKHPERFAEYRDQSQFITQVYLSHPDEPYNLRVRETRSRDGSASYLATLKDNGEIIDGAKSRLELETEISPEAFAFYSNNLSFPRIQKERAEPIDGVTIDWFADGDTLVEIEDTASLLAALRKGLVFAPDNFELVSDEPRYDNERRAHAEFVQQYGHDALSPVELNQKRHSWHFADAIATHHAAHGTTVVAITGRSGSGKSTLIQHIHRDLLQIAPSLSVVTLSTDDYNFGRTHLDGLQEGTPWTNWDHPDTFDLTRLSGDLGQLRLGRPIIRRQFDFNTQEQERRGIIRAGNVVIVEGLYAGHTSIAAHSQLHIKTETPLATCIGRRLVRDFQGNARKSDAFPDQQSSLRYMLEVAEPTFATQAHNQTA